MNSRDGILNREIQVHHQCAGPPKRSIIKLSPIRTIRKIPRDVRISLRQFPKLPGSAAVRLNGNEINQSGDTTSRVLDMASLPL